MTPGRFMRVFVALLLVLAASAALASDPLNLAAVETLLRGKVSQQRIVKLIKERKVTAHLTKDTAKKLKRLGASEAVVEAINSNPFAEIVLTSEPVGAEVFIDGRYRGTTPVRFYDVPAGKHELHIGRVKGYQEYVEQVDVPSGHWEKTVTLVLRGVQQAAPPAAAPPADVSKNLAAPVPAPAPKPAPVPAAVQVQSPRGGGEVPVLVRTEPVKSSLYLDGRYVGVTPLNFLAPVGTHRVRLVPSSGSRYEEVEKEISVVKQGLNVVFLRLNSRRD